MRPTSRWRYDGKSPKTQKVLEKLISTFRREIAQLRIWYDLGLESKGRTAVVNFGPDSALALLSAYALNAETKFSRTDLPFAVALRLAAQDLKAFYFEAAIARPGAALPESAAFNQWFWTETAAGLVLKTIKERCVNEADESLRMTGNLQRRLKLNALVWPKTGNGSVMVTNPATVKTLTTGTWFYFTSISRRIQAKFLAAAVRSNGQRSSMAGSAGIMPLRCWPAADCTSPVG